MSSAIPLSSLPAKYQEQAVKYLHPSDYAQFLAHSHNPCAPSPASRAKPKSAVQHESLGAEQGEKGNAVRYVVRVVSRRRRLLDEDNLCPKYFIDGLRYAGLLPADTPEVCHIETRQIKVSGKENEATEITIERHESD
jgi:hypothetical protein